MREKNTVKKLMGALFICCLFMALSMTTKSKAATTAAVNLNQDYTIELHDPDDPHLYHFTVPKAGNINIVVSNNKPDGDEDVNVSLYDTNNQELQKGYRSAVVRTATYSVKGGRSLFVKISSDDYHDHKVSYNFRVNYQATSNWEAEDNGSTTAANVIGAGKVYYGQINDNSDDQDFYRFYIPGNRKVTFDFGMAQADGEEHKWDVDLINTKNETCALYKWEAVRKKVTVYLKKGTYYLRVSDSNNTVDTTYLLYFKAAKINLKKPKITSIKGKAYKGFLDPNYIDLDRVKIKNKGVCSGYDVKVGRKSKKGKVKSILCNKSVNLDDYNKKGRISVGERLKVLRKYYLQVRSYVYDPFGNKICGSYSKVKCKKVKKKVYKEYK